MKINSKHICDDCESVIPHKFNKYGLTDICDKCEEFYQLSYEQTMGGLK